MIEMCGLKYLQLIPTQFKHHEFIEISPFVRARANNAANDVVAEKERPGQENRLAKGALQWAMFVVMCM